VDSLPILIMAGLILGGLWYACRPASVFVVRVVGGEPTAVRGRVAGSFLAEVRDACREHGVTSGVVRGIAAGPRIALRFSSAFPDSCQQQLRNWWAQSGWPAPKQR
jgi:hypothetical protein